MLLVEEFSLISSLVRATEAPTAGTGRLRIVRLVGCIRNPL